MSWLYPTCLLLLIAIVLATACVMVWRVAKAGGEVKIIFGIRVRWGKRQ